MSNNSILQLNNSELSKILNKINELPEVSDGSSNEMEDALITGTLTGEYTNDRVESINYGTFANTQITTANFPKVTTIGSSAFLNCSSLTTASFPKATSIGSNAFFQCFNLASINFPNVINIGNGAFSLCYDITTANFPKVTTIGSDAFNRCNGLTTASFPEATSVGDGAFYGCNSLITVSFPKATNIGGAFSACRSLTSVNFPLVTSIASFTFYYCFSLTTASFPNATSIGNNVFNGCYNLISLYLTGSSLCALSNSNAFTSTPIGGYTASTGTYGAIYVPASLLTSYKTASNWSYFSARIVAYGGGDEDPLPPPLG